MTQANDNTGRQSSATRKIDLNKAVYVPGAEVKRRSDKCYGGGVFKKFAEGIIGQERDEEKDEQGNVLSWSIDFQAYGRPIEDTPVLWFVEDGVTKYSRTLWRELAPSTKESLAKLQRVRGPWKSKNEAARVLGISRSQGNLHINELISKMYLTVSENEGVALT